MTRPALMLLVAACAASGCTSNPETVDYDLLFTGVAPMDYARIQCRAVPMADRHTCLTASLQHHQDVSRELGAPDSTTDGPIAVVLADQVYQGSYVSQPFAAAFSVSNGRNICRGRYNAFAGDTDAIFRVRCDDGARGTANLILDATGRNGIGMAEMNDGTRGRIVFGDAAVADLIYF